MGSVANRSIVALMSRTRSTIRATRVEVEKIRVPQAEIKTAGVIIALNSARPVDRSMPAFYSSRRKHAINFVTLDPKLLDSHYHAKLDDL